MSTCFMLMDNPIDLVMDLVVEPIDTSHRTSLEGPIEKYKVDFDAELNQAIFTFKMYGESKFYKLHMIADAGDNLEGFTSTEHFFRTIKILGLTINIAKSKKKSLSIKVDEEKSYVYLVELGSNNTVHKFHGWLEH